MGIGFQTLTSNLRGELIEPGHPGYEAARKVHNGMIDRRPAAVARCTSVADVAACVNFARDNSLLLAIRGGGHSAPGLGVCDGGLVADLSPMKDIRGGCPGADGASPGRLHLGGRGRGHPRIWHGHARWHHRQHRHRRPDARRRHRLPGAQVRPFHR